MQFQQQDTLVMVKREGNLADELMNDPIGPTPRGETDLIMFGLGEEKKSFGDLDGQS